MGNPMRINGLKNNSPSRQIGFEGVMGGVIVMMGAKSQSLSGADIREQIVDKNRVCGNETMVTNRLLIDFWARLGGPSEIAVGACGESGKHRVGAKKIGVVEIARVAEEKERKPPVETLDEITDGEIRLKNLFPSGDKIGLSAPVAKEIKRCVEEG